MKKIIVCLLFVAVACPATLWGAATIKELKLADGYDDDNTISSPIFDSSSALPLKLGSIAPAYDRGKKIVRKGGGGFFTKGPEYKLDKKIDLAGMLAEALGSEAPAMGFRLADGDGEAWEIQGTLKDVYLESTQVYMGATLFYGFMDVELQIRRAGGEPRIERLRAHNFHGAFNAGMGRRDEAKEALAHLLVEGAQEILARLNRAHFKAPLYPDLESSIAKLDSATPNDLHRLGLSGSTSASAAIVDLIPTTDDENDRARLIDALGRIGAKDAVGILVSRYGDEDEDCRWYTLKAMDYIGGDEAMSLVEEQGTEDDHEACKRLSKRILG